MTRKINRVKLSKGDREKVEKWLRRDNRCWGCPFYLNISEAEQPNSQCRTVCMNWFPRVVVNSYGDVEGCPCGLYSFKYVAKQAREMVRYSGRSKK